MAARPYILPLLDGFIPAGPAMLVGADPIARTAFFPGAADAPGAIDMPCLCFLVDTVNGPTLIDAGCGPFMGPRVGKLPSALSAAGVAAADIARILITHMHVDHVAGLVTQDGRRVFPNAELFVDETEAAFWRDPARTGVLPDSTEITIRAARMALDAYGDRVTFLQPGVQPAPQITPAPLPGHTPGHTGFWIGDGRDRVLMWGDVVHLEVAQTAHPGWFDCFDTEPGRAVATRRALLEALAASGAPVAGSHLGPPLLRRVVRTGPDAFRLVAPADKQGAGAASNAQ